MKTIVLLCLAVTMGACATSPHLSDDSLSRLEGVWRSDGYGYVLQANNDKYTVYDESKIGCIKQNLSKRELKYGFSSLRFDGRNAFAIGESQKSSHIHFDRLDQLPKICAQELDDGPVTTFNYFATTMAEHYASFILHGVNWQARMDKARPLVTAQTSERKLLAILSKMLEGIHDAHLGLGAEIDGKPQFYSAAYFRDSAQMLDNAFAIQTKLKDIEEFNSDWQKRQWRHIQDQVLQGKGQKFGKQQMMWGQIGDIAYLGIGELIGYGNNEVIGVNKVLDKVMLSIQGAKALVLDISLSPGGTDEVSLEIANRFLQSNGPADKPKRILAYRKYAANAKKQTATEIYVNASQRIGYTKPVYLLTSDLTTSAAEILTLAMRVLPNVKHIGRPTNGSFSDILSKQLPNGWELSLSNEVYETPEGEIFESIGVPPDMNMPIFNADNFEHGHAKSIRRVIQLAQTAH